jgi:hypothetical protein
MSKIDVISFDRGTLYGLVVSLAGHLDDRCRDPRLVVRTSYTEEPELVEAAEHIKAAIVSINRLSERLFNDHQKD